jgi:hypothetical protein
MSIGHIDKCKMCGGKVTTPKLVPDGLRKGQLKQVCFKCGHSHFYMPSGPIIHPAEVEQTAEPEATA